MQECNSRFPRQNLWGLQDPRPTHRTRDRDADGLHPDNYTTPNCRERKMRTNFLSTNFWNTPRGPGHPSKIFGTSQIPLFETQGRQTFEGEHKVFGHHPFPWKTPTPPGSLRTQYVNLCALFSCLKLVTLHPGS